MKNARPIEHKETMKDILEQKQSQLESDYNDTKYRIQQLKDKGYDHISIEVSLWTPLKIYLVLMIVAFACFGFYEELTGKNTWLHKTVRKQLGHKDLHNFLATESINMNMPYDEEVEECDYTTMTAKRFFNDYVKQNRPCLFKGYAKLQKAYSLW